MRAFICAGLVALLAGAAEAAEAKFTLTGENTKVTFVGTKADGKHEGGFKKASGTATLSNPADPTTLKISLTFDMASLYSDNAMLTGHLKSADFFEVKRYPKATFQSTKVADAGPAGFTVTGKLSMHGKTKEVSFPAKISTTGGLSLTSKFTIDRTAWGMVYGKGKVDDKVTINVGLKAK